jgi:hypothetical protein
MFRTDQFGRLDYRPFLSYQLPELVYAEIPDRTGHGTDDNVRVPFKRQHDSENTFTRRLFRLRWPGETDRPATRVPFTPEMGRIFWLAPTGPYGDYPLVIDDEGKVPISQIWARWCDTPGAILPPEIAYHVAVNPHCMGRKEEPMIPTVAGLPSDRVRQVLETRFCPDHNALATLAYYKWFAESHWSHPFFRGFDTNIRETLHGLQHEAVRLYFYLLADYRYDAKEEWWDRGLNRFVWQRLACYLHWVGRTGSALYGSLSHIRPAEGIRPDVVEKFMADVVESDKTWIHSIDYMADDDSEDVARPGDFRHAADGPSLGD